MYVLVCLQLAANTATKDIGVPTMYAAVTSVYDLKFPPTVVKLVNRTLTLSGTPQV